MSRLRCGGRLIQDLAGSDSETRDRRVIPESRSRGPEWGGAHESPAARYFARIITALWAALGVAAVLIWIAVRWRMGMPLATPRTLAALGADALLAVGSAWALYHLAQRWAERKLNTLQVLWRVALSSVALLLAAYAVTALWLILHGVEPRGVGSRLWRSGLGVAIDWSFFWAIALSVVPVPFIRARTHRPASVERIEVRSTSATEYVAVADVLAVIAAENYVELVLPGRAVLHRATLTQMMRLLGSDFVRVHRSALLRSSAISGLEREGQRQYVRLSNGRRVSLSRAYRSVLTRHVVQ